MAKKPSVPVIIALVGCGCMLPIIAGVVFCGGTIVGVGASMKSSEPYRLGLEAARNDPAVLAAFGGSIEPGTMVSGSINIENNNGNAEMSIPISGPGGKGSIEVKGTKLAGLWTMERIVVVKESGERWDLTPAPASSPAEAPPADAPPAEPGSTP